ncbi:hypothetical protein G7Z17_g7738 [Cylindrodendrum hubeiense]|uniref:Uncharacterized protein n=1 Tax=Cylindrodendrum hubeiense TaxID=595255 RepID=A0A9P5L749_9HYPO|nr:hypothetical protein G7Z17_g7738 [Cylindrodendrum hubeiense]
MLGAFSKLRRSTRSKRPPVAAKSRRPRPVSSHGAASNGLKPPASSSRRARSHESDHRRPHAGASGADPYYDDPSPPRRRDTRRSVSPRPRPVRDSGSRRTRPRRDASGSTDDERRPLSPRYPDDRYARRGSHRPADSDSHLTPSGRPVLRPYAPDSYRADDRRRLSYDDRRRPSHDSHARPGAAAYNSSSPAGSPARSNLPPRVQPKPPSPHAQQEPPRGRPRSRSRDGPRNPRPTDAALSSHPAEKSTRRPKPKPRPRPRPAAESAKPTSPSGGGDFFDKLPQAFATFSGLKILTDHADSAKEWAEWLNDLQGAPEEIQALSAKATTAKDTITQIQRMLEARPDLVEGESGQILKQQIESTIKSADTALDDMTELLQDLGNDGTEGTVWKGLQDFYNSYRYKNEWEEKIKEADVNLQKELVTLSTLMVNIYSRAIMKPAPPGSTATVPLPVPINIAVAPEVRPPTSHDEIPQRSQSLHTPGVKATGTNTQTPQTDASDKPREESSTPTISAEKRASRPPSPSVLAYEEATIGTELAARDPPASPPAPEEPTPKMDSGSPKPAEKKEPEKPKKPLSREDCEDMLLNAAWQGDIEATKRALLQVSARTRDLRGLTPLHLTVQKDHLALAMLLLDRGVDCNARAKTGVTPLHLAARFASAATVEFLLEKGHADPNSRRDDGRTPLHYAAGAAVDGDEEVRDVIRVLRDWGADPTIKDDKDRTPRDIAQKRDHWDAASTLRRAEKQWEDEHRQNWFQRHVFR